MLFFLCDLPTLTFSIFYTRQEHAESLMLRKKAKDLETEYKQLQLEFQGKEGRVIALEQEVEVFSTYFIQWIIW